MLRMIGNAVGGLVAAIIVTAAPANSFAWALAAAAVAMLIPFFASLYLIKLGSAASPTRNF